DTPVVTRAAAREGFQRFVSEAIGETRDQFSVTNALRGTAGPQGVIDRLLADSETLERRVVRPELAAYERQICDQFEVTLDAVASDEPFDAFADRLLAADSYHDALREDLPPDRRERVERALIERQRTFGERITPLVASPEESFWPAVRDAYDREAAERLVREEFRFTDPLDEFPDAFRFATELDASDVLGGFGSLLGGLPTLRVEYTDEAHRALDRAQRRVIRDTVREVDRQFAD
ncbi:MAG: hypothetical protein ABEI75_04030, partial [Halobaculum sp.]